MFGRKKKPSQEKEGRKKNDLSNLLGLDISPEDMADFGIGGIGIDDDDDNDEDDESLEAELAALQGESQPRAKKKRSGGRHAADLDDDDDGDDDDEDLENNTELLAELQCIAPGEDGSERQDPTPVLLPTPSINTQQETKESSSDLNILLEREKMYKQAIENANKAGEGSKARRYGRGLKEIEQMIKQARAGKAVDIDALPPPVLTGTAVKPSVSDSSQQAQTVPVKEELGSTNKPAKPPGEGNILGTSDQQSQEAKLSAAEKSKTLELFTTRRNEYRIAALTCKKHGDIQQAKQFLAVSKKIDSAIEMLGRDEAVDSSQLPPVPSVPRTNEISGETSIPTQQVVPPPAEGQSSTASDAQSAGGPPPPPKDVMEALQQRLDKYQSATDQAKKEGNSSKARRMARIVKQYRDAIKNHKAGKPVAFEELPTPPGYAPIPGVAASDDTSEDTPPASQA